MYYEYIFLRIVNDFIIFGFFLSLSRRRFTAWLVGLNDPSSK